MRRAQPATVAEIDKLTSEIARVAAEVLVPTGGDPEGAPPLDSRYAHAPDQLRQVIKRRRARDASFPAGLFADPAWDMLLDLTIARLERQHLSVTDVCVAAAVPQTTALRWIATLERKGLIDRIPDPHDSRRVIVRLSAEGWECMERYMAMAGIGLT